MSRLTDLIAQAKAKDPDLGQELEREFKTLASRRSYGLNFERHLPESVELPGRPVRKGDKVRVLPPRGSTEKGDQRLWKVRSVEWKNGKRLAQIELINLDETERQLVPVEDLVVVAEFQDWRHLRRDSLSSILYAEELNSITIFSHPSDNGPTT